MGCGAQRALEAYLFPEAAALAAQLDAHTGAGFARLNAAVAQLVDEWSMVAYCALDYSDEDSVGDVLAQVGGWWQPFQAEARVCREAMWAGVTMGDAGIWRYCYGTLLGSACSEQAPGGWRLGVCAPDSVLYASS